MKEDATATDQSPDVPRISLVIPAYNEEEYLPRLLDTIEVARANYTGGAKAIEVIVADNTSTDDTAAIAAGRGCHVVREEKRVIAAVRNTGARIARGQILCFVDADMQIHPDTFNAIERTLETGEVIGGATGVKLERMSLGIAVTYVIMVSMVWATGMDTGLVFCLRDDFESFGGYDESVLFAEDVRLLVALKKLGKTRKLKLVRMTCAKAISSMRKFDEMGDWHYIPMIARGLAFVLFEKGHSEEFAKKYWYRNA
jgi:glycosyltransferase involved in cell wall biosynthesis